MAEPATALTAGRQAVEGYFAAINSDRFAALGAVFAPDVEIHTVGAEPVVGRAAALAHLPRVLAAYSAHDDAVTRWIEGDEAIVCEIRFTGRLRTGRPIVFDALDVFDLRDGRITKVATWYDTRALARQIRG
ncbi:nuclear transport factor 2 family protein [Pseudonocardia zijingensis]|uniref:SnoaL-like domain-containing protein n=1 Tax=Pseudonocardia zijingensis TaxID=153376 RepID=A0ABN1PZI0_9PSEU